MSRAPGAVERLGVWLVTGPLGRVAAFLADASVLWWRWAVMDRIAARRGRR
ncbi:hypothetical protein HJD18_10240 [Thermoleophilia bacterium SCSIO 60948]|nr:hypothetical protein HJD18_10240 [Thermoleophilia bacterium SCSIO 60948]